MDLTSDKMAMNRVREAAEKAKIELSTTMETDIESAVYNRGCKRAKAFANENYPRQIGRTYKADYWKK